MVPIFPSASQLHGGNEVILKPIHGSENNEFSFLIRVLSLFRGSASLCLIAQLEVSIKFC